MTARTGAFAAFAPGGTSCRSVTFPRKTSAATPHITRGKASKAWRRRMKRMIRRALQSVGLAGAVMTVATAATVTPSWATPPDKLLQTPLARGTNTSHGTIPLKFGTDVAMVQITVQPGGSSGWHSHPGGAIIIVAKGTLTVYSPARHRCRTTTYSAGQAFIERPGEVDDVFNTGNVPYVLYVTFPRVPPNVAPRTDELNPGTCQVP